jgi:hypothetical protein
MRLGALSTMLMAQRVDHANELSTDDLDSCEVVFDTSDRRDLLLLSVYLGDDGKVHIDIGDADDQR